MFRETNRAIDLLHLFPCGEHMLINLIIWNFEVVLQIDRFDV